MNRATMVGGLLALLAGLGGCGGEARDVRQEMQAIRKDLRGQVDRLPAPPALREVAPLQVERDPFGRD